MGKRLLALALASLGASALVVPALIGLTLLGGNLHELPGGEVIRAAQMAPDDLARLVRERGVRSILNLRGDHSGEDWWRDELQVAQSNGVEYLTLSLSARHEPDLATMRRLATLMREAPKPLLIHCLQGADRTGLASAIYALSQGESEAVASDQLSLVFGHFPWFGNATRAMDQAFKEFATAERETPPDDRTREALTASTGD